MTWNYRVLAHQKEEGVYFIIHAVFVNKNGNPYEYTANPTTVSGDNVKQIRRKLKQMKKATKKPVLWAGNKFPEEY